jgi:hypothetical protein
MWRDVEKLELEGLGMVHVRSECSRDWRSLHLLTTGGQELNRTRIPVRTARSVKSLGLILAFFPLELWKSRSPVHLFSAACTPHSSRCRHSLPNGPVLRPSPRLKRDILTYLVTCVRRAQLCFTFSIIYLIKTLHEGWNVYSHYEPPRSRLGRL